jgi:hypothetical protein
MRLASVDLLRAIAIACMASAHLLPNAQGLYFKAFAGPIFLLVAGLGYEFFVRSRKDTFEIISRSLILFFLPLILGALIGFIISKEGIPVSFNYAFSLFKWNIFQVIAVGYLLGLILRSTFTRLIAIIISFMSAYFLCILNPNTVLNTGVFPLLPWIGFFIIGQIIYDHRDIHGLKGILLLIVALIPLVIYPADYIASNRTFIPIVISISSAALLALKGLKPIDKYDIIIGLGRITFSAYYIIMAVIVASRILPAFLQPSAKLAISVILMLSLLEIIWRRYDYIYGMEWFLRSGSKKLSPIIRRLARCFSSIFLKFKLKPE